MTKRILVIDDDPDIGALLKEYLGRYGFEVEVKASARAGLQQLACQRMDLIVLDVRLPDEDGFELLSELRQRWEIPVILLTGLEESADRVVGLELGADDYLTKPFDPRELLARIRAVLRRYQHAQMVWPEKEYHFAGYRLLPDRRTLMLPGGECQRLSRSELRLLLAFLRHSGQLLSRERLLELSHPHGEEVFDRSIDVQVLRLRRKLGDDGSLIFTERGEGYRFTAEVETD